MATTPIQELSNQVDSFLAKKMLEEGLSEEASWLRAILPVSKPKLGRITIVFTIIIIIIIREDIRRKKTFSFGHCPNHLTPPHDPNSGNLVLFFGRQKRRFSAYYRTK